MEHIIVQPAKDCYVARRLHDRYHWSISSTIMRPLFVPLLK